MGFPAHKVLHGRQFSGIYSFILLFIYIRLHSNNRFAGGILNNAGYKQLCT